MLVETLGERVVIVRNKSNCPRQLAPIFVASLRYRLSRSFWKPNRDRWLSPVRSLHNGVWCWRRLVETLRRSTRAAWLGMPIPVSCTSKRKRIFGERARFARRLHGRGMWEARLMGVRQFDRWLRDLYTRKCGCPLCR